MNSAASREANRIAAQTAVAATVTCECRFTDGRWHYCAEHFNGQHACPGCDDQPVILTCSFCGRKP